MIRGKLKKVSIIGHFGFGHICLDGQTVKTKILTDELIRYFGEKDVLRIDTTGKWGTLLKAPILVFRALQSSENIIMFPAQNGLRIFAPLLAAERVFFKGRKIHYAVIGGWLPQFLEKRPFLGKILKRFDAIYVETHHMESVLQKRGFSNICVLPNCKDLKALDENGLVYQTVEPYRLCTFSRVMREKGIEDAVQAVVEVNQAEGRTVYTLDIYGPVDAQQRDWFNALQETFLPFVQYKGAVPYDQSVETLKDYFALLFPTRFFTEGIPGTIIDAYASGLPVIASRWENYSDIIAENVTGIGYEFGSEQGLRDILAGIVREPQKIEKMKKACLKYAEKYLPPNVVKIVIERMN